MKCKTPFRGIWSYCINRDRIMYPRSDEPASTVAITADATPYQWAAVVLRGGPCPVQVRRGIGTIAVNELKAAMLGIDVFYKYFNYKTTFYNFCLYTDNINVLYLLRSGRCKWRSIPIFYLFFVLKKLVTVRTWCRFVPHYVPSAANKADAWSRMLLPRKHAAMRFGLPTTRARPLGGVVGGGCHPRVVPPDVNNDVRAEIISTKTLFSCSTCSCWLTLARPAVRR